MWVIVHPQVVVHTHDARNVLPKNIPITTAIHQWGNVGGLVAGLARGDAKLVGRCTEDHVAEPHRAKLVAGFEDVKQAAFDAGALGCSLSGSGPSMFAVAASPQSARRIASSMKKTFSRVAHVKSEAYISNINMQGACII
jgi:homoserine kinase